MIRKLTPVHRHCHQRRRSFACWERKSRRTSTYDVLTGAAPMREAVLQTSVPQLYIAPSTLDLSGLELEIGQQRDRAFRLRNALRHYNPSSAYVDAVLRYARRIGAERTMFYALYSWQVFVKTPRGDRRVTGPGRP